MAEVFAAGWVGAAVDDHYGAMAGFSAFVASVAFILLSIAVVPLVTKGRISTLGSTLLPCGVLVGLAIGLAVAPTESEVSADLSFEILRQNDDRSLRLAVTNAGDVPFVVRRVDLCFGDDWSLVDRENDRRTIDGLMRGWKKELAKRPLREDEILERLMPAVTQYPTHLHFRSDSRYEVACGQSELVRLGIAEGKQGVDPRSPSVMTTEPLPEGFQVLQVGEGTRSVGGLCAVAVRAGADLAAARIMTCEYPGREGEGGSVRSQSTHIQR